MERNNNVLKMIDVTQYMLFESSGDSDVKSDLNTPCAAGKSFSNFGRGQFNHGQNGYNHDDGNDDDDDDAESCSYDSSYGECVDGVGPDYRDRKGFVNQRDGSNDYNHFRRSAQEEEDDDDEMEEDGDAIDSKLMVVEEEEELPQKKNDLCTDFVMGRRQRHKRLSKDHYCSSVEFLNNQKETDKNFWDTCLAS